MVLPDQFPHHPEHVPRKLKAGPFWVCCDGRKVPEIPGTRRRASSTAPQTWRSYAVAIAAFEAGRHVGVGRVITLGDPYVGVDLDDVRNPKTGVISDEGREILELLDSYSELSPSGAGVKIWIRARLDRSYVKPGLEIYCRARYFTLTGTMLPQYPATIEERQEELLSLIEREYPRPGRGASAVTGYHGPRLNLAPYLERVEVIAEVRDSLGTKYRIRCPWRGEHSDGDESGTYIGQREGGGLWFCCHHAHCAGRSWTEFRSVTARGSLRGRRRVVIRLD